MSKLDKATTPAELLVPRVFSLEMQREYAQLESDQMTCAQMATLLFGPKTNAAGRDLSIDTWRNPIDSQLVSFFEAMLSELTYFAP